MKQNIIAEKSYSFSLKSIIVFREIVTIKREYILAKQFLRSATSIGANIEEAIGGQSRGDFISKLHIAYKEARECHYWLRLIKDSHTLPSEAVTPLLSDAEEIMRLLSSIIKTTKSVKHG